MGKPESCSMFPSFYTQQLKQLGKLWRNDANLRLSLFIDIHPQHTSLHDTPRAPPPNPRRETAHLGENKLPPIWPNRDNFRAACAVSRLYSLDI